MHRGVVYIQRDTLPYIGSKTVLVSDHTVPDIMDGIEYKHLKEMPEYDRISERFYGGSPESTARNIFEYLKRNVKYRIEPPGTQTVKSPGAIINQKYGDCKHYASFANGVLHSLARKGFPVGVPYYRFAGYTPQGYLQHVFSVLKVGGKEYWIDPVLPNFNNKKPYYTYSDVNVLAMPLYEINGIPGEGDDAAIGGWFKDLGKKIEKAASDVGKQIEKTVNVNAANAGKAIQKTVNVNAANAGKAIQKTVTVNAANAGKAVQSVAHGMAVNAQNVAHGMQVNAQNVAHGMAVNAKNLQHSMDVNLQNAKKVALKVTLATGRNAFLALLKANAFNMAHRLYDYWHSSKQNEQTLINKWEKDLGGDSNKLKTAITQGMRSYAYREKVSLDQYNKQHNFINGIPVNDLHQPQHIRRVMDVVIYRYPHFISGISDRAVRMPAIGMEPATAAALMTAAAAIIAALGKILHDAKWSDTDKKNAESAADAGAQLLSNAAAAAPDGTYSTGTVTTQDGTPADTLAATVETQADGTKTVEVQPTSELDKKPTDGSFTDTIKNYWQDVKEFVSDNKVMVGLAVGGVVLYKSGILQHKIKRRR